MAFHSILCSPFNLILTIFVLFSCCFGLCYTYDQPGYNTFTVSSFSYPQTTLRPFDLRYLRGVWAISQWPFWVFDSLTWFFCCGYFSVVFELILNYPFENLAHKFGFSLIVEGLWGVKTNGFSSKFWISWSINGIRWIFLILWLLFCVYVINVTILVFLELTGCKNCGVPIFNGLWTKFDLC